MESFYEATPPKTINDTLQSCHPAGIIQGPTPLPQESKHSSHSINPSIVRGAEIHSFALLPMFAVPSVKSQWGRAQRCVLVVFPLLCGKVQDSFQHCRAQGAFLGRGDLTLSSMQHSQPSN